MDTESKKLSSREPLLSPQEELKKEEEGFKSITFKKRESLRTSSRENEGRPPLDFTLGSRFNVPQEVKDADPEHIYGFIPYMAAGEQLQDVIDDAVERGWWPVLKSEHPILARRYLSDVFGNTKEASQDYVRKGGQILMKRLKKDHLQEEEQWNAINKRQEELKKTMVLFDEPTRGPLRPQNIIR